MFDISKKQNRSSAGFTIIELMVSVALFIVVVLVVGSSFVGLVASYRKTSSLRLSMDNLNAAIESMVRGIKTGQQYHCGEGGSLTDVQNCGGGSSYLAFQPATPTGNPTNVVVYTLGQKGNCAAGRICKSMNGKDLISGESPFLAVTSPGITINSLKFFVMGTDPTDNIQPYVVIEIQGEAGVGRGKTSFSVQTMVTQRMPDGR